MKEYQYPISRFYRKQMTRYDYPKLSTLVEPDFCFAQSLSIKDFNPYITTLSEANH